MKQHLQLMSAAARRREIVRAARRRWSIVLVVVLMALLPLGLFRGWRCYQVHRLRVASSANYDPTRLLRAENVRMQKQLTSLQTNQLLLLSLAERRPIAALLGLTGDLVAQQHSFVHVEQLQLDQNPLDPLGASDSSLLLEGTARDENAAEQLANGLRNRGPFVDVEVSLKKTHDKKGPSFHKFSVECVY